MTSATSVGCINIMTGGPERRSCRIVTVAMGVACLARWLCEDITQAYRLCVQSIRGIVVSTALTYAWWLCGLRPVPLYFVSGSVLTREGKRLCVGISFYCNWPPYFWVWCTYISLCSVDDLGECVMLICGCDDTWGVRLGLPRLGSLDQVSCGPQLRLGLESRWAVGATLNWCSGLICWLQKKALLPAVYLQTPMLTEERGRTLHSG